MEHVKINNKSSNYANYKYVIYLVVDGENWYYGAYNDLVRCSEILYELGNNARIVEVERILSEFC